jgi:hypothetical protein
MVICMDMESGERFYDEPQEAVGSAYDDEVLNANLVPPELALGLQEIPLPEHARAPRADRRGSLPERGVSLPGVSPPKAEGKARAQGRRARAA